MSLKEETKIPLSEWLTCKDHLIKLGFTYKEINTAINQIGYSVRDLTDQEELKKEPTYYNTYEMVQDWHTATRKIHITVKGRCFESCDYENYQARTYRVKARYQGLKHAKLIHKLLSNRLEWFTKFRWDIYELYREDSDIYLKTKLGSVYVPIKALLENNSEMIIERMKKYFLDYSRLGPYSLNHKEGETEEQYKTRRDKEMLESLKPLKSVTFKKLRELMR